MPYFYAYYKGDKFIDLGSKKHLAEEMGVSVGTITFYMSPEHRERSKGCKDSPIVIRIEEDSKNEKAI